MPEDSLVGAIVVGLILVGLAATWLGTRRG